MKRDNAGTTKLGILGGGQLGLMLIQSSKEFDVTISVLDPDPECPCAKQAAHFEKGDIRDFDTVYRWGRQYDLITIEIENVNSEALVQLQLEGKAVYPQPEIIKIVQDKGLQKQFYTQYGFPTAKFRLVQAASEIRESDLPCAQKLRTGGYDGRGVKILRTMEDLDSAFDAPSVLEALVDFEKEISVIVSRNKKGETSVFPCVECVFNPTANLVEFLFSPAAISPEAENSARKIALEVITKLNMIGLLVVEFFLTKNGDVLVNEIAPRPHNSGHHTIEANLTSQYVQHLCSILNLPPGPTDLIGPSVMVNILGEPLSTGPVRYEGIEEVLTWAGVHIHLYGKAIVKPYRKMGHVTVTAETMAFAREQAMRVKNTLKAVSC